MSSEPPGLPADDKPELDRRYGERRINTEELLIRLDERVAVLIQRIDNFSPQLEKMRSDIKENTERSMTNKHTTDRHENLLNWRMRVIGGIVLAAILYAAGFGSVVF